MVGQSVLPRIRYGPQSRTDSRLSVGEGAKPRQGDATRPPPCANSRRDSTSAQLEVALRWLGDSQRVMTEPMCNHNERVELLNQIKHNPRISCKNGDMED